MVLIRRIHLAVQPKTMETQIPHRTFLLKRMGLQAILLHQARNNNQCLYRKIKFNNNT